MADTDSGLSALSMFPDLEDLTLEKVAGVDLAALAQTHILGLGLFEVSRVDLGVLAALDQLQGLMIIQIGDCTIPAKLRLAGSLEGLTIFNDGSGLSGQPVADLVERIDWSCLGGLRTLLLHVGGNHERGIFHDGPGPSPLEPPFPGLSRNLTWVRVDAVDPEPLRAALEEIIVTPAPSDPGPHGVTVYKRFPHESRPAGSVDWEIRAFDGGGWGVYGSLYAAVDSDEETEYEAAERAQERLLSADAELANRLDFDPEANGTGIYAESREDLETALRLLGLVGT